MTEFSSKPESIEYMRLPDGQADVWLRQSIEEVETEDGTTWTADEVYFRTSLSKEEVTADFDTLFASGGTTIDEETGEETTGTTITERVDAIEEGLAEIAEMLIEIIGGE